MTSDECGIESVYVIYYGENVLTHGRNEEESTEEANVDVVINAPNVF